MHFDLDISVLLHFKFSFGLILKFCIGFSHKDLYLWVTCILGGKVQLTIKTETHLILATAHKKIAPIPMTIMEMTFTCNYV